MKNQDRNIAKRIKKGDIQTFETLFHQHYPGMLLYAQSLVRKKGPAEEVVQDVFYNIWKNRENFHLNANWKSYLYRAVYNNSMLYLRKWKHELLVDEKYPREKESELTGPLEELGYKE
ncbi:MAG: hypothetical protein IH594_02490, partial [Bacteroidales bacterium]|nr:hypothetical protein [Bacteroidales bacterium]